MNNKTNSTKPPMGSSHLNPVPIGSMVKTKIERGDAYSAPEVYDLEITILETVRGKAALEQIKTQGVTDKPPIEGFEYLLARIQFGYFRRGKGFGDSPYRLAEGQFIAVSQDGKIMYELPDILQQPQPQLAGSLFKPGESREGWLLFQAPQGGQTSLLIFDREYEEGVYGLWGYVWFQI
jgi:hypothetical protein